MFSKPHHQPPPHPHPFPHSLSIAATPPRDSRTAGNGDTSGNGLSPVTHSMLPKDPVPADGGNFEVGRRRGRPPGSKNKPKSPVVVTGDTEPVMSPYILEVPGGSDVVEAIERFCRRKNTGLCVFNGYGTVSNVTLRQPSVTPGGPSISFRGHFDILSVCATFLPHSTSLPVPNGFAITLAGPQGQIFGGLVAGSLSAAGTVFIIAASFNSPLYQRLPLDDEVRKSSSGDGEDGHSPSISGGKDSEGNAAPESCGMPRYGNQISSDVLWASTSRQPPPHHRPY